MRKLYSKNWFKYLIAFSIPLILLLSILVKPLMTSAFGEEIIIKTMPNDPRDIFRGDYVTLDYEISEISLEDLGLDIKDLESKDDIYDKYYKLKDKDLYVVLDEEGDYYNIKKVTTEIPEEDIYLIGRYSYTIYNDTMPVEDKGNPEVVGIKVEYSLDKYYVPENTGLDLEKKAEEGSLIATIKVYRGYALLENIK
ncbi:GDYXXLXY domain-containing protein [Clostridium sp. DL1XJH146]